MNTPFNNKWSPFCPLYLEFLCNLFSPFLPNQSYKSPHSMTLGVIFFHPILKKNDYFESDGFRHSLRSDTPQAKIWGKLTFPSIFFNTLFSVILHRGCFSIKTQALSWTLYKIRRQTLYMMVSLVYGSSTAFTKSCITISWLSARESRKEFFLFPAWRNEYILFELSNRRRKWLTIFRCSFLIKYKWRKHPII